MSRGRFIELEESVLTKIREMDASGIPMTVIQKETGVSMNIIRNRLGRTKDGIATNKPRGTKPKNPRIEFSNGVLIELPPPIKPGKYDHLFNEKINEGLMYTEYLKCPSVDKVTKKYSRLI